jgi:hypothetical protein
MVEIGAARTRALRDTTETFHRSFAMYKARLRHIDVERMIFSASDSSALNTRGSPVSVTDELIRRRCPEARGRFVAHSMSINSLNQRS